ncbi:hypothetical protein D3C81_2244570 [compost metagenome]
MELISQEKIMQVLDWAYERSVKSATSGFITGLDGLITLPVALPANTTSVLFV